MLCRTHLRLNLSHYACAATSDDATDTVDGYLPVDFREHHAGRAGAVHADLHHDPPATQSASISSPEEDVQEPRPSAAGPTTGAYP